MKLKDKPTNHPDPVDIEQVKAFFDKVSKERDKKPHDSFMPYVLIRSCAGDHGRRPLSNNTSFWESPDIWITAGAPDSAPTIPANQGGTVIAGKPNTVYAHVWNLGRAPIAGVRVEWYWFNPSLGFNEATAHLIGITGVELSARGFPGCHKLVQCPHVWVPVLENGGHECLVARVSAFGDPLNSSYEWDAWADRHVAQRNVTVVYTFAYVRNLLDSLDKTKPAKSTVRLYQIGQEAADTLILAAPHLTVDPRVKTTLLAELRPDGDLMLPPLTATVPRIMPHLLLNLGNKPQVTASVIRPTNNEGGNLLHEGADVPTLLHHGNLLSAEMLQRLNVLPLPKKAEAQVLRIVSYKDNQPIGGYTIIVSGA